jgi:hypothetical protein
MLRDATRRAPPEHVYAQFHGEVVASLPHAGFVLSCDDIALWLAAGQQDPDSWRPARSPEGRRRAEKVLALLGAGLGRRT